MKLIDFEISKMKKHRMRRIEMWTHTGTLQYKAPEMLEGNYNELIDIWAVGVMTYEILTGHLPFFSEYLSDTTNKIIN
jgi:serine/threonine protein kinase